MNKILIIISFLVSVICISSQSWGLPPCSSTGIKDNCYGTLTSKKSDKYEGEFKDNKKNGQGTYTLGGQKYVGTWVDGQMTEKGTYTYSDRSVEDFKKTIKKWNKIKNKNK